MPIVKRQDGNGDSILMTEYNGMLFPTPTFEDLDTILPTLPQLRARSDDVIIVDYPKSGSYWMNGILTMLLSERSQLSNKPITIIEQRSAKVVDQLPSARILTTHVQAELFPQDFVRKKSKIIFLSRNPKDAYVSLYHNLRSITKFKYHGSWDGFLTWHMTGNGLYGSWFDFMNSWELFLRANPDLPVLRLCYEDLHQDLRTSVDQTVDFLGVDRDTQFRQEVVIQCQFSNMKKVPVPDVFKSEKTGVESHPNIRKGIIGDWKNHFTVAQSQQFDAEYRKQMGESRYGFEKYM